MSLVSYNCTCDDTTGNSTLATLRARLMRRLGWGAMVASPPPGVADLLNDFLQSAQVQLYQRPNGEFRTERFFSWPLEAGVRLYDLPDNAEAATLATPSVPSLSTSTVGGTLAAGTHSYRLSAVNAQGETLASTAVTQVTTGATSTVTVTFPVPETAPSNGADAQTHWRVYGRVGGSELLLTTVPIATLTYTDTGATTPSGALPTLNTTYQCNKSIDARKVTWVGIRKDALWRPLAAGIAPELYNTEQTSDWPLRYEIRQCIEVWPPPDETDGELVIKGRFGLEPFTADSDTTTINSEAVFLLALANAKAHYRQPDAANYVQQLEVLIHNLVAGSHHTRRYLPGYDDRADYVYTVPRSTVPFPDGSF